VQSELRSMVRAYTNASLSPTLIPTLELYQLGNYFESDYADNFNNSGTSGVTYQAYIDGVGIFDSTQYHQAAAGYWTTLPSRKSVVKTVTGLHKFEVKNFSSSANTISGYIHGYLKVGAKS